MSTSNDIIGKCRASIKTRLPRPRLSDIDATEYIEPLEEFIRQAQDAGCRIVQVDNAAETDRIIKETYPDAKRIASALPIVKCANLNPDTIPDPHELNDTDVGVVEGSSVWRRMVRYGSPRTWWNAMCISYRKTS